MWGSRHLGRLKSVIFSTVGLLLYRAGFFVLLNRLVDLVQKQSSQNEADGFPWIQKRTARPVHILMYHGIDDAWSPFLPPIPVQQFRNHLEYLATYCHVLGLDEAVERIQRGDIPQRAVVITIDDGYRDSYVNAFPILKEMGLTATVFLATAGIGTGKVLWHDQACWMISQTNASQLEGFGSSKPYLLNTLAGRRAA